MERLGTTAANRGSKNDIKQANFTSTYRLIKASIVFMIGGLL